ncbi:hypothetical protein ABT354_26045 [Streptomyces sp. NPDC000594]|uniref:hypothetical protein n=1 Tax=Streptomyces sp. NPDC000594 TaxID=3154261 RepID=UPI003317F7D4
MLTRRHDIAIAAAIVSASGALLMELNGSLPTTPPVKAESPAQLRSADADAGDGDGGDADGDGDGDGARAGSGAPPDGRLPGFRRITLITGDRVQVGTEGDDRARIFGFRSAEGRERIALRFRLHDGKPLLVPDDAWELVRSGRLDPRLFDITGLSSGEDGGRGDLRVTVGYARGSAAEAARDAVRAAVGVRAGRTFGPAGPGTQILTATPNPMDNGTDTGTETAVDSVVMPRDPAALWHAVTRPGESGLRTAAGIARIWLDDGAHRDASATVERGPDSRPDAGSGTRQRPRP